VHARLWAHLPFAARHGSGYPWRTRTSFSEIITPQFGAGACTPRPRKEIAARSTIAQPNMMVAWATIRGIMFGTMCRRQMDGPDAPLHQYQRRHQAWVAVGSCTEMCQRPSKIPPARSRLHSAPWPVGTRAITGYR
jgi:hypothetical protein